MKVAVIKHGSQWHVEFSQGVQFFRLDYDGNKAECHWMAKMLRQAIRRHDVERDSHD